VTQTATASGTNTQTGTAGTPAKLGQSGCDCDLGSAPVGGPGIVLGLLGAILVWRRTRRRN
jgi:MYXO-CTERM domain-containing protein